MVELVLTLCLLSNPLDCEVKKISIYRTERYCTHLGQFELASIMKAYDSQFIKKWKCK